MGETHMRLAFEREIMYAQKFPFIDYGADLNMMAAMEKGIEIRTVKRSGIDTDPPEHLKEKVEKFLGKVRSRRHDFIPEDFLWKGGKGYILKNWIVHRGIGSAKVTRNFRDAVRLTGSKNEH
jgi:hypothetical protein